METTILFSALSEAIYYSILQGFLVYAFVKLIMKVFYDLPSSERYKILYIGLIWIFVAFIVSFSDTYMGGLKKIEGAAQMQNLNQKTYPGGSFASDHFIPSFSKWIAICYFAGLLTQSAMLLLGLFRVRTIRKKSLKSINLRFNSQLLFLSKKLMIGRKVKLSLSHANLVPCTIGFIRPIILFPIGLINSLSPAEVEAILLHELSHIKRNDYLFNILQRIMEMILFFNPVVWFLGKEIRKEREYCCDDIVLQNSSDPAIYAHALLQIAENKTNNLSLSLSVLGEEKYTLLNRIKRFTNMKTNDSNPKHHLFTSLTVVAVCLSLAWMIPAEKAIKKQENNPAGVNHFADTVRLEPPAVPATAKSPSIAPTPLLHSVPAIAAAPPAPRLHADPPMPAPIIMPHVPEPNAVPFPPDTNKINSPEWKKHMQEMKSHAEEIKKHFDSPEWKKHIADMKINAEKMESHALAMEKKINSPELKKKLEEMKSLSLQMKTKFDSPEWKKKIEEMKMNSEDMRKQFDSPEWKKKIEEMKINSEEIRKQFDSPEWKMQIEEIKKKSQEIKKEAEKLEKSRATQKN